MMSARTAARNIEQWIVCVTASLAFASYGGTNSQVWGSESSPFHDQSAATSRLADECESAATASGHFVTHSTTTGVQQANGMLYISQDVTFTLTGDDSGTAVAKDLIFLDPTTGTGTFVGFGTETGTILGRTGTIGFVYWGTFAGNPPHLMGHVRFLPATGTGELSGLSGEGTLQGIIDVGGTYSINICLDHEDS